MSARPSRARLLAVLVLVLTTLGAALPAAATTSPSPTPSGTAATFAVDVRITSVSPTVLRPGEDLTVRATLRNTTDETIEHPGAVLRISRFRLGSRAELATWADGSSTTTRSPDASASLDQPLAPGASADVTLTVPAAGVQLKDLPDTWGPRGLSVVATDGGRGVGTRRTFLLWLPESELPDTPVSVLVPVTGPALAPERASTQEPAASDEAGQTDEGALTLPASPAPDAASLARLDDQTASGGRLDELLSALSTHPQVAAAVDPALLTAASSGGASSRAWASDLTSVLDTHEAWSLPAGDPDLAAIAHSGRSDLAALPSTLPSTLPRASGTLAWAPGTGAPDDETVALTPVAGAEALVVPAGSRRSGTDATPTARATVRTSTGQVAVLVPDDTLTTLVTDPDAVEPGSTTATTVQRALAELAVIGRENPDDPVGLLVAPGRDWEPDVPRLMTLLGAIADAPWSSLAPVSTLLRPSDADTRLTVPTTARDAAELAPTSVQALAAARDRAVAFATVTSDPATLLAGVDADVLAPLSVAWRQDAGGRAAQVVASVESVDARTSGLTLAPLGDVNVISASSDIRMSVRNELAVPATVRIDVRPGKPCVESTTTDPVTVAARSEESVTVTLVATANCEVKVAAVLTATDGTPVSAPVEFTARVSPTIENVGTIVVGVLLAIGLVLGVVRTVRRGQSGRRGARHEAETDAPTTLGVLGGTIERPGEQPATKEEQ